MFWRFRLTLMTNLFISTVFNIAQISLQKVIAPSLVVHLLLNYVQSTSLDALSSVMCLA